MAGFIEAIGTAYCAHHSDNGRTVSYVAPEWDLHRAIDVVKGHVVSYGNIDGSGTSGGWSIRAALALMNENELAVAKARWPYWANRIQAAYTETH